MSRKRKKLEGPNGGDPVEAMSAERQSMLKFLGLSAVVPKTQVISVEDRPSQEEKQAEIVVLDDNEEEEEGDVQVVAERVKPSPIDLTCESSKKNSRHPLAPIFRIPVPAAVTKNQKDTLSSRPAILSRSSVATVSAVPLPSVINSHVNYNSSSSVSRNVSSFIYRDLKTLTDVDNYAFQPADNDNAVPSKPRYCLTSDAEFNKNLKNAFFNIDFNSPLFQSLKYRSVDGQDGLAEKYRPRELDEFIISPHDRYKAQMFYEWLESFKPKKNHQSQEIIVDVPEEYDSDMSSSSSESDDSNDSDFDTRKSSKRRRKKKSSSKTAKELEWAEDEDWSAINSPWLGLDRRFRPDSQLMEIPVSLEGAKAIMFYSPHSSFKTTLVSVLAERLGYRLLEINSSQKRDGSTVAQAINEAVRSHRIDMSSKHQKASNERSKNMFMKFMKKKTGSDLKEESTSSTTKKSMTAVILEEVDVLFESDNGFWRSVLPVLAYSKRPIILTCNDLTELPEIAVKAIARGMIKLVPFRQPDTDLVAAYLSSIAKYECYFLDPQDALQLAQESNLKKSLQDLEFLCRLPINNDDQSVNIMKLNDDDSLVLFDTVEEKRDIKLRILNLTGDRTSVTDIYQHVQDLSDRDVLHRATDQAEIFAGIRCRNEVNRWDLSDYINTRVLTCQSRDLNSLYFPYIHRILSEHYKETITVKDDDEIIAEHLDRQERQRLARNHRSYSTRRSGNSQNAAVMDPYFYQLALNKEDKILAEVAVEERQISSLLASKFK